MHLFLICLLFFKGRSVFGTLDFKPAVLMGKSLNKTVVQNVLIGYLNSDDTKHNISTCDYLLENVTRENTILKQENNQITQSLEELQNQVSGKTLFGIK